MYNIDFNNKEQTVHFIGIGGISMSGLAELLLSEGFRVTGSDSRHSPLTDKLSSLGASIKYPQASSNIDDSIDIAVATAAIHKDNPELQEILRRKIPLLTRAELLGQIMKQYDMPIAVSGTHGKTTTTSMISEILLANDNDPTLSIGGMLNSIGGNFRVGSSELFVTEACEYTNSFLSFFPKIAVILNVDADHLDFFKDINDIRNSFRKFASLLPDDGTLVINADIPDIDALISGLKCRIVTFGKNSNAQYQADNIRFDEFARPTFTLLHDDSTCDFTLGVPGSHNVYNAMAAIAVSDLLLVDRTVVKKALESFCGTERRFQYKGSFDGVTVIDDYAHHPTEIKATLNAARHYPHKTIWCVFQPHTYTRTKALMEDFAEALTLADKVVLADIYAARETDDLGISSRTLMEAVRRQGTDAYYFPSFEGIEKFLLQNCINGDLLITMGAGDIVKIGNELLGI